MNVHCNPSPVTNYLLYSRTITGSFRVGISTVSQIVPDAAAVTRDMLMLEFISVPNTKTWRSIEE